eukprot:m.38301 g.38301  ORF g.38301 m.38301 type:complete len:693 (+) comp13369_c0_seq2:75-2153(+)
MPDAAAVLATPASRKSESTSVVVAVRCRPFNSRERELKTGLAVRMAAETTTIINPKSKSAQKEDERTFTFDFSFWSHDPLDPRFHSQQHVYESIGQGVLDNALNGFNACIFAYGQTGSGKTYSMMGTHDQPGVIPRLCRELFTHVAAKSTATVSFTVEVSYLEIYNEQTFDLLKVGKKRKPLRTRNHKTLGPYVEGLSQFAVAKYESVLQFMESGNAVRTVAATAMNDTSSRSHAIFSLVVKQTNSEPGGKRIGEKVSKISLVDLAGSERQSKTGASGARLKEGSTINKSLITLGMVIAALADRTAVKGKGGAEHIPYRDSTLTFLLKESLGGNSKTVMIATVSPAAENFDESLSTLRYAARTKQIVNKAFVNEDATAAIIQGLRAELEALRLAAGASNGLSTADTSELRAEMEENERLLAEANLTWEDKLRATESELLDRAEAAEREARVRQRENEALRREMDELREAKAREEQFRISGLKAHEAVRVAEIASMEQKLAEEKGRARKFQATLSTESDDVEEELTRQREEIARMRTEQAELIAMLQVKERALEREREARLAAESSIATKAQLLSTLALAEVRRREEVRSTQAEWDLLASTIEGAKMQSIAETAKLQIAHVGIATQPDSPVKERHSRVLSARANVETERQDEIQRWEQEQTVLLEKLERLEHESKTQREEAMEILSPTLVHDV